MKERGLLEFFKREKKEFLCLKEGAVSFKQVRKKRLNLHRAARAIGKKKKNWRGGFGYSADLTRKGLRKKKKEKGDRLSSSRKGSSGTSPIFRWGRTQVRGGEKRTSEKKKGRGTCQRSLDKKGRNWPKSGGGRFTIFKNKGWRGR